VKPVAQHLADCLALVVPLPAVQVCLADALGCVLAADVHSRVSLPPFDNSSMDGYAVVVADLAGASEASPVVLPVAGDLPAGAAATQALAAGTAVRIMTGAPVPVGTEAVVPVEWTDAGVARVGVMRQPESAQNIRRVGEDVITGDLLVAAGTSLTSRHIGLLAATGHDVVVVHRRPRVVVMSTGSEIVPPGGPLEPGQIYDSNSFALAAAVTEAGGVATRVGAVDDDARVLMAILQQHLPSADVVVTTGGVSAGAYDTVKEVLSRLGTVRFDKVAMQPGMPQGMGRVGVDGQGVDGQGVEGQGVDGLGVEGQSADRSVPILTLPGNPVSAVVSFEVFVRPVIRTLLGERNVQRPTVAARAGIGWRSPPGKRQYVRVRLSGQDGARVVEPVGGHGSHLVADLSQADALAVVPEDVTAVEAGDELTCLLLERGRP